MLLRITRQETGTLKLEGRLVRPFGELLEQECSVICCDSERVTLDFSAVTLVDRAGIESLKRLQRRGIRIRGCSNPVASVLEAEDIAIDR